MTKRVWVLGDAVVDLLPEGEQRLAICPGGAPANVAVGIARLGGNSAFIGCVGQDPFGQLLQSTLEQEGVDTRCLRQLPDQRTSTVLVGLDDEGERTFTFMVRPSADLFLSESDLPTFAAGEGLHLCSIALSAEPSRSAAFSAMRRIRQAGGWVSFDPNLREDLWRDAQAMRSNVAEALRLADIIKLSLEELHYLTDSSDLHQGIARFTTTYQPALLLITQGKAGVTLWRNGETQHFPAPQVKVVDTTGAGDAFVAGLLAALIADPTPLAPDDMARAIANAQRCGALATTARGAMTALPRLEQA
ncbi:aminoimidazole riboside kinase [Pantoea sp. PSNIH4]|nr:fructokinase [Pantoea sp. PSNIH2]MDU3818150.1 aminoimidazole riboside kinase [Pantoea sp.]POU44161.1 aminoimidazole riboside kinase [Pantoea sp. PSNIH5]POU64903.1 aminoimidazole riboside kinase [Pantoea sp. PSNIH4]POY66680.1 aminoimidazole riboside kinase [Pantoea sp. PSNIH3]